MGALSSGTGAANYAATPPAAGGGVSPYTIAGSLPFSNGGASQLAGLSGNPTASLAALGSDYASAYNSSLQMNSANYANILSGYQQTANTQAAAQNQVAAGYGTLGTDVQSTIQGITQSQQQAINDAYAGQVSGDNQTLINRGLGNTTVQQSVDQGDVLGQQKASVALANQMAQLSAGYQSSIGLAGLGYQGQAIQANTAEANQQLGFMNSVNAAYPNASQYSQLAQQYGAQAALQKYGTGGAVEGGGGGLGSITTVPNSFLTTTPSAQYGSSAAGAYGNPTGYGYNPALAYSPPPPAAATTSGYFNASGSPSDDTMQLGLAPTTAENSDYLYTDDDEEDDDEGWD